MKSNKLTAYSDLPIELLRDIALQTSPDDLSKVCRSDRAFSEFCNDIYFWKQYFNEDQELFHKTLVSLASQGDIYLFSWLWRNAQNGIVLVRERRTLVAAFKVATKSKEGFTIAKQIWNLDKEWMNNYHGSRREWWRPRGLLKNFMHYEVLTKYAAEKGNRERFAKLIEKLVDYVSKRRFIKYIEVMIVPHSMNLDFAKYILTFIGQALDTIDFTEFMRSAALHGNIDLVDEAIRYIGFDNLSDNDVFDIFSGLLYAKNSKAVEYLTEMYEPVQLHGITPELISGVTSIGNPQVLIDYAKEYPEDWNRILGSFKALPAQNFVNLLKSLYRCIPKHVAGDEYLLDLQSKGYDYLVYLLEQTFETCEDERDIIR